VKGTQTRAGHIGYRSQLDRARRFLDRLDTPGINDVDFQDIMWAFFQNCWHVKDWLHNDPKVDQTVKAAAIARAHDSVALKVCQEMCNGTKHLGQRLGASHDHIDTNVTPGGETLIDCIVDNGAGKMVSGRALAHQCIAEWVGILEFHGLATARMS
jgi:hypothetical protein